MIYKIIYKNVKIIVKIFGYVKLMLYIWFVVVPQRLQMAVKHLVDDVDLNRPVIIGKYQPTQWTYTMHIWMFWGKM